LDNRKHNGKPIAASTRFAAVNTIGKFFSWLSNIDGYKRVITYKIIEYFKLTRKEKNALKGKTTMKKYPSIEEIKNIVNAIPSGNILGRRLRAIICFLILTGARIGAVATMKIGQVDLSKRLVLQDPGMNVATKYGKYIETTIPYIDESLFQIMKDYCQELAAKGFNSDDPLFPKAENEKEEGNFTYKESSSLSREFMSEKSMNKLVKAACREADYGQYHCHSFRKN